MMCVVVDQVQEQLQNSVALLKDILGADLLGVYLYGSALVGGLQKHSDIDLFVLINRPTTIDEKRRLVEGVLEISGVYMKSSKRPIEMTLVERSAINPWIYPPRFDFQYGEWLRESFIDGVIEPWQTYEMPDLALLLTQLLLKSKTLSGQPPAEMIASVPYADFMKAMLRNLDDLEAELMLDTRNVLLTYARIWSTLETNAISPKPVAAAWVMSQLPEMYQPVMKRARSICVGLENEYWDDVQELIKPCADFMIGKIKARALAIDYDNASNAIRLIE